MGKKAIVTIKAEDTFDDSVDEDSIEEFVEVLWEERFNSVGFDEDRYEVSLSSIEDV